MTKEIEIRPQIARLIQRSCQQKHVSFEQELARYVVEQSVMALDPELELIVEADSALSEIAPLPHTTGVNDVVVNGQHIHVISLTPEGTAKIKSVLAATDYLKAGSLVVKLTGSHAGAVIGKIDAEQWQGFANGNDAEEISLNFSHQPDFSLSDFFQRPCPPVSNQQNTNLKAEDYLTFLKDRDKLPIEKQRQIVSALLDPATKENFRIAASHHQTASGPVRLEELMREAATWNARVERVSERLVNKFPTLGRQTVEELVLRVGEKCGGQTELPEFRKSVAVELTQVMLKAKLSAGARTFIEPIIDCVNSGKESLAAAKQFVKNPLSLDLARAINEQRKGLVGFANVTADEFVSAFQSLSIKPAYATHSQKENVGLEAVDEALFFLETAQLAEQLKELEF